MPDRSRRYTSLDEFVSENAPICYGILKPGKSVPGGIPVVKVKNISNGRIRSNDLLRTALEIDRQYERSRLNEGDILLTIRGTTGRTAVVPPELHGANITQDTARIRVASTDSRDYVFYALQSARVQRQIDINTIGQAVKGINIAEVRKLELFHPSKQQQNRIATILSTWDKTIETTERLFENSKAQKKALMQQLLTGKKRLPGFGATWPKARLGDVFERITTRNRAGSENVLTISGKHGLVNQRDFFKKRVASSNLENYTLLRQGDFAYNKSYSTGYPLGAIKPLERYDVGVVSSLYLCFRLKDTGTHCHDFYRHYFEGGYFDKEIYAIAQEGARNHGLLNVGAKEFFAAQLASPSPEEQIAIASVINAAEAELGNFEDQLTTLQCQKRALMQHLLTGKRRVKVAA